MGRDLLTYRDSVYLEPLKGVMPQSLGDEQLGHFARDNPQAYGIDEAARGLNNPHIEAEISRLHDAFETRATLWQQHADLDEQTCQVIGMLFNADLHLQGICDCMEHGHAYH